ncbi:hypothetical protein HX791_10430 [Pseudomonas costantinii]|nr:hypothetical protein [Pseudomonas costantinii]
MSNVLALNDFRCAVESMQGRSAVGSRSIVSMTQKDGEVVHGLMRELALVSK